MITITEIAAQKLREVMEAKGVLETHALRVFVAGGSCGGVQYGMAFDSQQREDDEVYEQHGVRILVDPMSLTYVDGARIDYEDRLMGGGFHIENPNAASACGCESSSRAARSRAGGGSASCGCH
ncbi:MAG: iron-sulfur cluster assembly accessory protein [Chloroflexi bacterium]|nr:iron-sulfur cluster assembly accessory protein [Chloroflexota bacterium]